jgi:hypothetical protein
VLEDAQTGLQGAEGTVGQVYKDSDNDND